MGHLILYCAFNVLVLEGEQLCSPGLVFLHKQLCMHVLPLCTAC